MNKLECLKQVYGYSSFRDGQEAVVDALMAGRDAMCVMPTGAGKSVCYQLPAMLLDGVTLVVSPLISLMKDQVMALKAAGVPAAFINSSLTPGQCREAMRRAAAGAYRIVYIAPERLDSPDFLDFTRQVAIPLVAVDEAHCISQWGQDFRPSYLRIAAFLDALPRRPAVGAFTATATRAVRDDVVGLLGLRDPLRLTTGFDRPNLYFEVRRPKDKLGALLRVIDDHPDAPGIVYCSTRKNVEEVCALLRESGYAATRYHAGLADDERRDNQDDFRYDRARVMVATNAFGMGIDKSDVRFVVHYNMPKNIESYYQEAGRAGRDGAEAVCTLLYGGQDVVLARWMIEHGQENEELTREERDTLRKRDLARLRDMTLYATSSGCLRRKLLQYFGERAEAECGRCSGCNDTAEDVAADAVDGLRLRKRTKKPKPVAADVDAALLQRLKALRNQMAKERGIPAFVIFTDATLIDMAQKRPETWGEMLGVSGVGNAKLRDYGGAFLAALRGEEAPSQAAPASLPPKEKRGARAGKPTATSAPSPKLTWEGSAWSASEDERLLGEYDEGMKAAQIAGLHRRSVAEVRARLRHLNLEDD